MVTPASPNLPDNIAEIPAESFSAVFESRAEQELGGAFSGITAPGLAASKRDFREARFKNCRLFDLRSAKSYYTDVSFTGCDLSNADFSDCYFSRVVFRNCRLTGARFYAARLYDTAFENCKMEYTVFSKSKFRIAAFNECNLADSSFEGCAGKDWAFAVCDLTNGDFRNTPLAGHGLSSNIIAGISFAGNELRGATVSPIQALELAGRFGVVIQDE